MLGARLFPNSLIKKNKDIFGHLSILYLTVMSCNLLKTLQKTKQLTFEHYVDVTPH